MTYVNWWFGVQGLSEVAVTSHLENDPGPGSHLYLQPYDAPIDGIPAYHGLQTIDLAIFSRFGTVDLGEVRPAAGAQAVAGTDEGPFVSLRMPFALGAGSFWTQLRRAEPERGGDWFEYRVARADSRGRATEREDPLGRPGDGGPLGQASDPAGAHAGGANPVRATLVGAIRFPRARRDLPATLEDGGGSWTEFWDNNGPVLHPVPYWRVRVGVPLADQGLRPKRATLRCSRMPNGVVEWDPERGQVVSTIGGDTWRRDDRVRSIRCG